MTTAIENADDFLREHHGPVPGDLPQHMTAFAMLVEVLGEAKSLRADRDRLAARVAELEAREASQREAAKEAWAASCVTADGRWAREPEADDPCPVDKNERARVLLARRTSQRGDLCPVSRVTLEEWSEGVSAYGADWAEIRKTVSWLTRQVEAMRGRG